MKRNPCLSLAVAIIAAATFTSQATIFFSDSFTNGSTLNSATPANPTTTNTAYEIVASKTWSPTPSLTSRDLKFGIGATSSGYIEAEALFATNAIALTQPGDTISLTVVFTNTTGLLTTNGQLGLGLYNSGQVKPVAGGINNAVGTFTGAAQNWQGYVGLINQGTATSRILARPTQSGASLASQDLVTIGTSSSMASSVIGTAVAVGQTLPTNSTYTVVLTLTLIDANNMSITNTLYAGAGTGGTLLTNFGAVATSPFAAAGFDALAIGYCGRNSTGGAPLFDVSSIQVTGSVTVVSGPPTITQEPVDTTVASGGSCPFTVAATGFNMTYQWHRYGTNLLNGGNISGVTTPTLIINNASTADAASGVSGYYVTVTGAGNFSTNSTTNSLTIVTGKNLIWSGAGAVWDFNTTANWNDPVNPVNFNYGDAVTFNDTGSSQANVTLTGNFLSASKWTITENTAYAFGGTGSFAGTGSLVINSAANQQFNVVNNHTGGTIISNTSPTALVNFQKYESLGNGPLTLAKPGKIEVSVSGSAAVGIPGDVTVSDDFTNQFDGTGTFAGVFLGNISGTAGKTLTLTPLTLAAVNRYRVYGSNTVCNANINLVGTVTSQAQYNGTVLAPYNSIGTQTYNGIISGDGGLIQRGTGTTILNGVNTYAGGTTPTAGIISIGNAAALGTGPLNLAPEVPNTTGSGTISAFGAARTIANAIVYPSGTNNQTLIVAGSNSLTFTSPFDLAGADGNNNTFSTRLFMINNTAATTLAGAISDSSGATYGLTKAGTGALYLNGANTFTGQTTNNAGLLAGSGNAPGNVFINTTNASIGGGSAAAIGTFTVVGSLTFSNGGGFFRLNRGAVQTSDRVSVSGALTNNGTGTISVTNLGAALQVGDTFTLFSKALSNGVAMTITNGGVIWNNNLALNGTITVASIISTAPPLITGTVISGSNITISGTNGTAGGAFSVYSSTNLTTPRASWALETSGTFGAGGGFSVNIPVSSTTPAKFYLLKLP